MNLLLFSDENYSFIASKIPISHNAFKEFWVRNVYPRHAIKTSEFLAKLVKMITSNAEYSRLVKDDNNHKFHSAERMMINMKQVVAIFGLKPRIFEERVNIALDYDGVGVMSALKLDRITQFMPKESSLADVLLVLSQQRGQIILPPLAHRETQQKFIAAIRNSIENIIKEPFESDFGTDRAKSSEEVRFSPFEFDDLVGDDAMLSHMTDAFSSPGWHLIGGAAGVGKTTRVLSALRKHLHTSLYESSYKYVSNVSDAVSMSQEVLDPLCAITPAPRTSFTGLDAIYVDLRNCNSATEIMSALTSQLVLRGDSIQELEVHLGKLLRHLRPHSVVVLDNVCSAQGSTVLAQLLEPYAKVLSFVVVTAGSLHKVSVASLPPVSPRGGYASSTLAQTYDDVLQDVVEGLGGINRLNMGAHRPGVCTLEPMPRLESELMVSLLIREHNAFCERTSLSRNESKEVRAAAATEALEVSSAGVVVGISGNDIVVMGLLAQVTKTCLHELSELNQSRVGGYFNGKVAKTGVAPAARVQHKGLTPDDVFMAVLSSHRDCFVVIAALAPLLSLANTRFDKKLAVCLVGPLLNSDQFRFEAAWTRLETVGWIRMLESGEENKWAVLSTGAALAAATVEYAVSVVIDGREWIENSDKIFLQAQSDSYYLYTAEEARQLSEELSFRRQSVVPSGFSTETASMFVPEIPTISRPFSQFQMRELINEIDIRMPHLFPFFSLWMDSGSHLDTLNITSMSGSASAVSRPSEQRVLTNLADHSGKVNDAPALSSVSQISSKATSDKQVFASISEDDLLELDLGLLYSAEEQTTAVLHPDESDKIPSLNISHSKHVPLALSKGPMNAENMRTLLRSASVVGDTNVASGGSGSGEQHIAPEVFSSSNTEEATLFRLRENEKLKKMRMQEYMTAPPSSVPLPHLERKRRAEQLMFSSSPSIGHELQSSTVVVTASSTGTHSDCDVLAVTVGASLGILLNLRIPSFRAIQIFKKIVAVSSFFVWLCSVDHVGIACSGFEAERKQIELFSRIDISR